VALATIPLYIKTLEVYYLLDVLPISTTTIHTRFFSSSSFIYRLLTLDSSGVLPTSPLTKIPSSTKHPRSVFSSPPSIPPLPSTPRFFAQPPTHELDRPSYRQAMSTPWQVSPLSHEPLPHNRSSQGVEVVPAIQSSRSQDWLPTTSSVILIRQRYRPRLILSPLYNFRIHLRKLPPSLVVSLSLAGVLPPVTALTFDSLGHNPLPTSALAVPRTGSWLPQSKFQRSTLSKPSRMSLKNVPTPTGY
jgi:hypothetical protein